MKQQYGSLAKFVLPSSMNAVINEPLVLSMRKFSRR